MRVVGWKRRGEVTQHNTPEPKRAKEDRAKLTPESVGARRAFPPACTPAFCWTTPGRKQRNHEGWRVEANRGEVENRGRKTRSTVSRRPALLLLPPYPAHSPSTNRPAQSTSYSPHPPRNPYSSVLPPREAATRLTTARSPRQLHQPKPPLLIRTHLQSYSCPCPPSPSSRYWSVESVIEVVSRRDEGRVVRECL